MPDSRGGYVWVERDDPRVTEVRLLSQVQDVGEPDATSPNLLIQGDAYNAMHALIRNPELALRYRRRIKLVYIDPPFNTGQAFEHYEDALEHSIWLGLMRERLLLIRDLLAPDGSVWVHLDASEAAYCRALMDEIFGRSNFAGEVIWRSTDNSNNDAKTFSSDHNVILVFSRSGSWLSKPVARTASNTGHYKNPDNDPRGPWFDGNPVDSPSPRDNLRYTIESPQGHVIHPPANGWRWKPETLWQKVEAGEIKFTADGRGIRRRTYLWEQGGLPPSSLWANIDDTGSNRRAKAELKRLFPGKPTAELFKTPKPEKLIRRIIEVATEPGDIVLDCFAGSGTTAAVAHKLGRHWVTVELSPMNVRDFIRPRLERVVAGKDMGGVTSDVVEEPEGELPDGIRPGEARRAAAVIKALEESGVFGQPTLNEEGSTESIMRLLRKVDRVKKRTLMNWSGGGGFRHLVVGPSMYETYKGKLLLADWAIGEAFDRAAAAQLSFFYERSGPFVGHRGRARLAVLSGVADEDIVRALVTHLDDKERLVIVSRAATPEAAQLLRNLNRGSRLLKAPTDLVRRGKVIR